MMRLHSLVPAASRILALGAILLLAGCATTMDRSIQLAEETVVPITVSEGAQVSAFDLAEAMLQAGFSERQILADGPAVRNALATSGGAQVRYNHVAEAVFAVNGNEIMVTSRTRGNFTQPLRLIVSAGDKG